MPSSAISFRRSMRAGTDEVLVMVVATYSLSEVTAQEEGDSSVRETGAEISVLTRRSAAGKLRLASIEAKEYSHIGSGKICFDD